MTGISGPGEALLDGGRYYDPVPCPAPAGEGACGQPLHLEYTASQYLYASHTEKDLAGLRPNDMESWQVVCEAGHVLLLPPDDGAEQHLFGVCACDPRPDDSHDSGCAAGDFGRLKGVISLGKPDCAPCNGTGKVTSGNGKQVDCWYCGGTGIRKR